MIEKTLDITTDDGAMPTFIVHPEQHASLPVVILFMDAPGIREELRDFSRKLANGGYYVMLPNLYYRSGVMELGPTPADPQSPERKRILELMFTLTIPKVMNDTRALIAHVATDNAARNTQMGALGYCMSGPFAINAAGQFPDVFAAAASIHGVKLVTDAPDSPHLIAHNAKGELYFACAENDVFVPLAEVEKLKESLQGVNATVEIFAGVGHGFVFPSRNVFEQESAARHWDRLFALYRRKL